MWALYGFWATACTDSNYTFAYDSLQGYKQTLKAHRDSGYVPLTLTVGQYNELKDSAIADSLIRYKNGQLEDIANRPANPYKTQYLAAGSPAMRSIAAYPVTYRIPDALITGPLRDSISQLYINFGDSAGYRTVQTGTDYGIDYADTGQKTLTYKVVLTRCSRFAITNNSGADLKSALAQGAFNTAPAKGFPCANLHFRKKERETFPQ